MSFYVSTATFFLLHCDEWDRVVALPRHKFVTEATLLQLKGAHPRTIPAKFALIWFSGFRGEDLNVISINRLKEKFHRKAQNICYSTHCHVAAVQI